jgi:anaerobic magnesium-protoporphyrin IX monomethyl ester cyclase
VRVLFVYSLDSINQHGKPLRSWSSMQHGISYISALLKAHGHETSLLVLGSSFYDKSRRLLQKALDEFAPGVICFSSVYSQHQFIERMAAFAKERYPEGYRIAGGVHATLQPEAVIKGPFDAICIGEGEFPVLELCEQLEKRRAATGIPNLWIKQAGDVERNEPRQFIQDLETLPFPDYEIWQPWIEAPKQDAMTVFGGRGCPYDCTYCSNHAIRKVAPGRYVRTRPPEEIVREIRFLHSNFPHREIYLEVETLDCNKEWTLELCEKLAAFNASVADPVSFGSNYRINPRTINEGLFSALQNAGFTSINIGLEAGSERIRREVLKRRYSNEDFLRVVSLARKHGLKVYLYNMIGLPGESLADHQETVRLNRLCQPEGHHTGIFQPYPGTELYSICLEMGLIEEGSAVQRERRQPVMDLPGFSKSQILSAYTWFEYHVYRGYKPLPNILSQVAQVKIDSSTVGKYLFQKISYPLKAARELVRRLSI